jgi:hypothetical protein
MLPFFWFVYVTLHMPDIQRATTRRQLTQHPKTIPRACSSYNELAIAKITESKEAKARACSWRKEKTYVFDGRDGALWRFMGAMLSSNSWIVRIAVKHQVAKVIFGELQSLYLSSW